jgi:hypothetical protein
MNSVGMEPLSVRWSWSMVAPLYEADFFTKPISVPRSPYFTNKVLSFLGPVLYGLSFSRRPEARNCRVPDHPAQWEGLLPR